MAKNLTMPSPIDIAYIEPGVHAYIMDVLRDKRVDYQSPMHDLIYNEIVRDLRKRIECSVQSK